MLCVVFGILYDPTIQYYYGDIVWDIDSTVWIGGFPRFLDVWCIQFWTILNNYSGKDVLMSLSCIAVAVSIIFSYILAFAGVQDGWLDLLKVPMNKRTDGVLTKTTLAILAGVTFAVTQLKELAFLMSLAGATLGNALIYVYTALMFCSACLEPQCCCWWG